MIVLPEGTGMARDQHSCSSSMAGRFRCRLCIESSSYGIVGTVCFHQLLASCTCNLMLWDRRSKVDYIQASSRMEGEENGKRINLLQQRFSSAELALRPPDHS